jgi:hypothetical protein
MQVSEFFTRGQPGALSMRIFSTILMLGGAGFILHAIIGTQKVRRQLVRIRDGKCPQCEYDMRGTPSRCPECGCASEPVN